MQNQEQAVVFDKQRAATYDARAAKVDPLCDTLLLLLHLMPEFCALGVERV